MLNNGLKIFEYGTIDSPPWPDPVGFRDVRLHKKGIKKIEYDWVVPVIEYIKTNKFPFWMDLLRTYDISFRKGYWKLPFFPLVLCHRGEGKIIRIVIRIFGFG